MKLEFCENIQAWNEFLLKNNGNFLQSFEWGEFQKSLNKKVWRVIIKNGIDTLLQAQIIKEPILFKKIFLKNYFYIPYGPILNTQILTEVDNIDIKEFFKFFLEEIEKLAKKENVFFLKIEPTTPLFQIPKFDFYISFKRIQPQKTLILDLNKTAEDLLKNFNKRTRYNIKLAEKKGVEIEMSNQYSHCFYELLEKTKKRQNFHSYSEEYYKKLLTIQTEYFKTYLFLAKYEHKIIVASIVIFFGNKAVSLHTGSDHIYSAIKAPYLLRWKVILKAKEFNKRNYDFWGIDEKKWPGITQLKKGFNGQEIEYPTSYDIVFQKKWYLIYKFLRTFSIKLTNFFGSKEVPPTKRPLKPVRI